MDVSIYIDLRAKPDTPPTATDYDDGIDLVRIAERLGFHGVWTSEQHGVDDGYLPAQFPVLAAIARETTTIRLGTGVILLPLTHPRRVVEDACVVDVLSGGRLTLGLGAGNYPNEFRIFGVAMSERRRLMDEGVAFVRSGLAGGDLPDGSRVGVPPVQRPVPLVLGGLTRAAVERAARLADGHFAYSYLDPEVELPRLYAERLVPALEREGHRLRLIFASVIWASEDAGRVWQEVVGPAFLYQQRKYLEWEQGVPTAGGYAPARDLDALRRRMFVGRPAEIVERLLALREGYPFDEVVLWVRLPGIPFGMAVEHLQRLSEDVLPMLRRASR